MCLSKLNEGFWGTRVASSFIVEMDGIKNEPCINVNHINLWKKRDTEPLMTVCRHIGHPNQMGCCEGVI